MADMIVKQEAHMTKAELDEYHRLLGLQRDVLKWQSEKLEKDVQTRSQELKALERQAAEARNFFEEHVHYVGKLP
jgi:succinate dehydrogenase flavin-adding protein (antitoxin of CptAB toxin-antitoxin module)